MATPAKRKDHTAKSKFRRLIIALAIIPPLCIVAFFVFRFFSLPTNRRVSHEDLSSTLLTAIKNQKWIEVQGTFCSDTNRQLISDIKNKQGKSGVVGSWKFIRREKGHKVNGVWVTPLVYQVTNTKGKTKEITIHVRFNLLDEGACITEITGL